uniref:Protein kinase domain-containing protein n=1 Tax=Anisakis simplex TaxID=6269 RepID=A0A0M3J3D5_ANISI
LHYEAPARTIHRDLKSGNVVLTRQLVCKLCDFGGSKNLTHSETETSLRGTIPWMSPEMIRRDKITTATDVWSYGVVLWELITREVPYEGHGSFGIWKSVTEKGSTLAIPEQCPADFKRLMENCWQMDAKKRCNILEVIDELNDMPMKTIARGELQKMRNELQKEMKQMVINESKKLHAEVHKTMRDELQKIREETKQVKQEMWGELQRMRNELLKDLQQQPTSVREQTEDLR